ncbi:MAG: hypothetical protein PHI49_09215 [Halothiobacillaceae bacterium]|nr:hypothetical protein [Halothiobacillaceae bacterium]
MNKDVFRGFVHGWVPWSSIERPSPQLKEVLKNPGVYVIAHSKSGDLNHPWEERSVIYVGETSKSLGERLKKFEVSATREGRIEGRGAAGHSGGIQFFIRKKDHRLEIDNLYVSLMPVVRSKTSSAYIRYAERVIIWEYVKNYSDDTESGMPLLNSK